MSDGTRHLRADELREWDVRLDHAIAMAAQRESGIRGVHLKGLFVPIDVFRANYGTSWRKKFK